MKQILSKLTIMASCLFAMASCSSNGEVRDLGVTPVKSLYEPADQKAVVLKSSASASLFFEWEPSLAEDGSPVQYEIAFDKVDGDFSKPFYQMAANNNGGANFASISHKQLNRIAAMAGIESAAQGTFKWTVLSSRGHQAQKAIHERTLTVTRLSGFADIPENLYIMGEATETDGELKSALIMKRLGDGEFEIYTKLTQGKAFKFVSDVTGTPVEYSLLGEKIVEGGTSSAAKTGIFKYYLDFNIGAFTVKEVTKVNLFLCWSQMKIELPYIGQGVWGVVGHEITGLSGSDNNDDRYKFRMESTDGETEWRSPANDSKPTGNEAYYYMVEKTNVQQWTDGQIWKTPATDGWSGKTYDISFSLKSEGAYTHNLVIK